MNFVEAMTAAQAGFDTWAAKPHNKKWAKMIYHTPIPNDLLVNIAEAVCRATPEMQPPAGPDLVLYPAVAPTTLRPCEKHPDRYCNCEGYYPACRPADERRQP